MGDLAYGKRRVQPVVTFRNTNALKTLQTLAGTLDNFHLNNHGITGAEVWKLLAHLLCVKLGYDFVSAHVVLLLNNSAASQLVVY
jgi:hypothetical protein